MRTHLPIRPFAIGLLCASALSLAIAQDRSSQHRKAVEDFKVSPGWHAAMPTGARFAVALPCPFKDLASENPDPRHPVESARSVMCRIGDRIQFTASQYEYRNETEARSQFEEAQEKTHGKTVGGLPAGYGKRPTFEFDSRLINLDGRTRAVLLGNKILMLVVEWRPVAYSEVERQMSAFYSSLRIAN